MAGFIFTIGEDKEIAIENAVEIGLFSSFVVMQKSDGSLLSQSSRNKLLSNVLADYLTMKEGDNVYFFANKKIYGVGTLFKPNGVGACYISNYPSANDFNKTRIPSQEKAIYSSQPEYRWVCFFKPEGNRKHFFENGVAMDDVLQYKPQSFRMLRAMEGVSFIKIDDEENLALKEFIYLKNTKTTSSRFKYDSQKQKKLISAIGRFNAYQVGLSSINQTHIDSNGDMDLEILVEANVIEKLKREEWDYISHQVIASPYKPVKWMKRMDVFAYKYLANYPDCPKPIEKYLVIEIKKDKGNADTVLQVMHYVDWICKEYANGDYGRISAQLICKDYTGYLKEDRIRESKPDLAEAIKRQYIIQTEPLQSEMWKDLKLFTYSGDKKTGDVTYDLYADYSQL